jgi:ABC-2 type transport system permease protein
MLFSSKKTFGRLYEGLDGMNLFFRELKSHRKGLFFWCLGMAALVGSGMAKFAAYQDNGFSFNQLLDQFPKTMQVIFGLNGFDLTKASGFYGVLFLYIALMAAVHAVLLGSEIIAKEERDKTTEFLFVRPISRTKIITSKLAAGLCDLIILNAITLASSVIFVDYFNKGASVTKDILVLMAGLFFLQLIFFFIGMAVAGASKKPKTSASVATSVLLFTFILSYLIDFNSRLDFLKYFTPFKYFDARVLVASGRLDPVYVAISLAVIASLAYTTYSTYQGRDLNV